MYTIKGIDHSCSTGPWQTHSATPIRLSVAVVFTGVPFGELPAAVIPVHQPIQETATNTTKSTSIAVLIM